MKVRMVATITGLRNGVAWPAPGEEMDLPQSEAETMAAAGHVVVVTETRPAQSEAETMAAAGHVVVVTETRPAPQESVEKRTTRKKSEGD